MSDRTPEPVRAPGLIILGDVDVVSCDDESCAVAPTPAR
jgi:hypothetical protein